jgi:hypothetical protein
MPAQEPAPDIQTILSSLTSSVVTTLMNQNLTQRFQFLIAVCGEIFDVDQELCCKYAVPMECMQ